MCNVKSNDRQRKVQGKKQKINTKLRTNQKTVRNTRGPEQRQETRGRKETNPDLNKHLTNEGMRCNWRHTGSRAELTRII